MSETTKQSCEPEYDFALIVGGVSELTQAVEDALFSAGCDDATLSIKYGLLFMEFSRSGKSLLDAILSAIRDVSKAGVELQVLSLDECDLVTASEIARRIDRSRQLVHQYITGKRGGGEFPAPECHLSDHSPLWSWREVSHWMVANSFLRPEVSRNATVVAGVNNYLKWERHRNLELDGEMRLALKGKGRPKKHSLALDKE
jgi:hypothetical protein